MSWRMFGMAMAGVWKEDDSGGKLQDGDENAMPMNRRKGEILCIPLDGILRIWNMCWLFLKVGRNQFDRPFPSMLETDKNGCNESMQEGNCQVPVGGFSLQVEW